MGRFKLILLQTYVCVLCNTYTNTYVKRSKILLPIIENICSIVWVRARCMSLFLYNMWNAICNKKCIKNRNNFGNKCYNAHNNTQSPAIFGSLRLHDLIRECVLCVAPLQNSVLICVSICMS